MKVSGRIVVLVAAALLVGQTSHGETMGRSIVMPPNATRELDHFCSRLGPPEFDATWTPTDEDVQIMEKRLAQVAGLRSKSGIVGASVKEPHAYHRQYFGIVSHGRKLIYINASCGPDGPPPAWERTVMNACDGGSCHWGVVYDPTTRKFSDLEMNGDRANARSR